jgi:hypothetical protein
MEVSFEQLLVEAIDKPGRILEAYHAFHDYSVGNQLLAFWQCALRGLPVGPLNTYKGWQSFEPWLTRIEQMDEITVRLCADGIPLEWYGDTDALENLIDSLCRRRAKVRQLIAAFRDSSRNPFPLWKDAVN